MKVLFITPPFTQLNTPYPATAYLKGFMNTLGIQSFQTDLSLEVILAIFNKNGLTRLFSHIEDNGLDLTDNAYRIFAQHKKYIHTIDAVIGFLQNKNQTLALTICSGGYLPEAGRFENAEDLDWAFGNMGTHDKARHLATLYLEDLGDLITEVIDPYFGFSRYAERLGRTATHFDEMYQALNQDDSWVTITMKSILTQHMHTHMPDLVCITAPFPGNVFSAFQCGKHIKSLFPATSVAFGGGYANTELRSIFDTRVFEFLDFILLDDGEAPLQHLIEFIQGKRSKEMLKRTFCLHHNTVTYYNNSPDLDIPQREVGTPDYSDLWLDMYLSVIEIINPMHRLWSDGRWNKLTLAHGCYWGKCSFCDVTLDYIQRYEPVNAALLCDRIEQIISQTHQNGFHFVDEAAPPALMRDLAIEIVRRDLTVVWWTNIRFEKSFTPDLCRLLRKSGCIAISGGLEVASDRLLSKMQKGVTVAQVARVAQAFTDAGIMVHAYLMYGFPTQTVSETIDSLEMVRQMFAEGVIQSGFWHQFAMTAHSPVGINPAEYGVTNIGPEFGGFAENDLFHLDPTGADHEKFSTGLKSSIFNYMQGLGLDEPLDVWFDFRVPKTKVNPTFIHKILSDQESTPFRPHDQIIWIGGVAIELIISPVKKSKKNPDAKEYAEIILSDTKSNYSLFFEHKIAQWVIATIEKASPESGQKYTFQKLKSDFETDCEADFSTFVVSDAFVLWRERGLLIV